MIFGEGDGNVQGLLIDHRIKLPVYPRVLGCCRHLAKTRVVPVDPVMGLPCHVKSQHRVACAIRGDIGPRKPAAGRRAALGEQRMDKAGRRIGLEGIHQVMRCLLLQRRRNLIVEDPLTDHFRYMGQENFLVQGDVHLTRRALGKAGFDPPRIGSGLFTNDRRGIGRSSLRAGRLADEGKAERQCSAPRCATGHGA